MALIKPETKRFFLVVWKFLPVALNYRRDRREIRKAEGKLVHPEAYKKHAVAAVNLFIELGPAYIKLGQLLSVRPDVLPQPYIEEFSNLQDEVPPAPFDEVKITIEQQLGKPISDVFDSFDKDAVTGASLGQVYRAVYKGEQAVVKVNRPGIRERIQVDTKVLLRLVPLIGRFIDKSLQFSAKSIIDQFSDTIKEEMDYRKEAQNLLAIKKNLKSEKDVLIPKIYPEISSERLLVLEYIGGIKITDVKSLDEAGIDRRKLARRVAKIFFMMLLSQDLFHADPHPGNMAVRQVESSEGKKAAQIILYDFGMTGTLDPATRLKLIRFYTALVDFNSAKVVDMMLDLGLLQPDANRYVIRRGVELALADMQGQKVEETEVKALLEIANRTIYLFPFKLPKNLVLYMRMLSMLEGVCLALDQKFRFVKILGGLLEDEGLVEEAYKAELQDAIKKVSKALDAGIEVLPLLKGYLEQNYDPTGVRNADRDKKRSKFLPGLGTGLGVAGLTISIIYFGKFDAKLGFVASLIVLIFSAVYSRS
ncbi:MAG: AarF/ABC1/UbiB kinase family protein [Nitrososphaerales archaeon]|jgi:predicted unusual protein kinase regulating ubiquinone biosynthesis (AarF/ABC1/UbiB family)